MITMTLNNHHRLVALIVTLLFGFSGLLYAAQVVQSHSDPVNCSAAGVGLSLSAYRSDGATPIGSGTVTVGESIVYRAQLSHLGTPNCNYEGGQLTITRPDNVLINASNSGVSLITTSTPFISAPVTYVVRAVDVGPDNDLDA